VDRLKIVQGKAEAVTFFTPGKRTNEATKETLPSASMPTAAFCEKDSSKFPKLLMPKACYYYDPVFSLTAFDRLSQPGPLALCIV